MHKFYNPNTSSILSEEESRHCIKVMRMTNGDRAYVLDGKGNQFLVEITDPHPKKCSYQILDTVSEKETTKKLHIAIAPTKNMDRIEFFVEKVTEIGCTEISFILCQNSERKVIKMERLQKIAISAMKQSGRLKLPLLHELTSIREFIKSCSNEQKMIAHLRDNTVPISDKINTSTNQCVLIGPEGDFSLEEIALALENNFTPISLGKNVLRTETAGIVACTLLSNF